MSIEALGKDVAEAMKKAVEAFAEIVADIEEVKPLFKKEINLGSKHRETIVGDFFEQLLYLMDVEGFVPCCVEELSLEDDVLHCVLSGDSEEHCDTRGIIKSIVSTDIEEGEGRCRITLVVEKGPA